jgi:hypothetical protein
MITGGLYQHRRLPPQKTGSAENRFGKWCRECTGVVYWHWPVYPGMLPNMLAWEEFAEMLISIYYPL